VYVRRKLVKFGETEAGIYHDIYNIEEVLEEGEYMAKFAKSYSVTYQTIREKFGIQSESHIRDVMFNLFQKHVYVVSYDSSSRKKHSEMYHWFDYMKETYDGFEIKPGYVISAYLFNDKAYLPLSGKINRLQSKYAISLYRFCMKVLSKKIVGTTEADAVISVEDIKSAMYIPKHFSYARFKQIFNKCAEDISAYTDLDVESIKKENEVDRVRKKVNSISFHITKKEFVDDPEELNY
jgi:hypothetical protein